MLRSQSDCLATIVNHVYLLPYKHYSTEMTEISEPRVISSVYHLLRQTSDKIIFQLEIIIKILVV